VQFEITEQTRAAIAKLIHRHFLRSGDYPLSKPIAASPHLSTRQYARIVQNWVRSIGLNLATYGTHSLRRTKAALIYRKTGNLRAVQLLLGHSKLSRRGGRRRHRDFRGRRSLSPSGMAG
jgi:site-specific recombinase XerD